MGRGAETGRWLVHALFRVGGCVCLSRGGRGRHSVPVPARDQMPDGCRRYRQRFQTISWLRATLNARNMEMAPPEG